MEFQIDPKSIPKNDRYLYRFSDGFTNQLASGWRSALVQSG